LLICRFPVRVRAVPFAGAVAQLAEHQTPFSAVVSPTLVAAVPNSTFGIRRAVLPRGVFKRHSLRPRFDRHAIPRRNHVDAAGLARLRMDDRRNLARLLLDLSGSRFCLDRRTGE
jgi:hypothetical protein